MRKLRASLVDNLNEAYLMAEVRNTCADYMTQDNSQLTKEKQQDWYENVYIKAKDDGEVSAWLFYDGWTPAGYGFVRIEKKRVWLTAGLIPVYRGLGYGRWVFEFFIKNFSRDYEVWLEVLKTNKHAVSLYKSLKFQVIKEDDKKYTMKLKN